MKRKRLISLLVLLAAVVTGAWAQGPWISGDCTVTLSDGVMTVSGTGAMADYEDSYELPWYGKNIKTIVIESGVTSIGNSAFAGSTNLESVSIPASVTSIGNLAFQDCGSDADALTVSFAEGSTPLTIGEGAFNYANLTSIDIPNRVTSIGERAFQNCSKLESVSIPASVTSIGTYAFQNCGSDAAALTVSFAEGSTPLTIGEGAFYNANLTSIDIPNRVTSIGYSAFVNCAHLESVSIPASVTSIGEEAFGYCGMLAKVSIYAPSLTTYGLYAFQENAAGRKIYVLPEAVDTYKAGWPKYAADIEAMTVYATSVKEGTEDAENWSATPSRAMEGQTVTITYAGTKSVKSVTAKRKTATGNITVYFTDSKNWGDVNVYYWNDGTDWPGTAMTFVETNEYNQKIYRAVIPATAVGVIFNGNGKQTADITTNIADGSWWYATDNVNGLNQYEAGYVGKWYEVKNVDDNKWTFTMPDGDMELDIEYNVAYPVTISDGDVDAANWSAPTEQSVGQNVTLQYTGKKKIKRITIKAVQTARTAAEATAEDIGKLIGADGNIYDSKDAAVTAGTTAVAVIAYVGSETYDATFKKGLAIALADEKGDMIWSTAKSTCEGKTAITGAKWCLPSQDQWKQMFKANGGDDESYTGLITTITTAGGATLREDDVAYWSSSECTPNVSAYFVFLTGGNAQWIEGNEAPDGCLARACLVFGGEAAPAAPTVIDLSTLTADYEAKDGETLTGTLASNVKISIADGATVTLKDVNITNLGNGCDWAGINCPGDATLVLEGTNTVCAGRDGSGNNNYPGIYIAPGKTLTIQGDGTLTAYSNSSPWGAGIGGGWTIACGNIVINGGTITATGGSESAGIGGGYNGSCGNITINGGTITATGGQNGAGIGGSNASCGNITINGGTITATGGDHAAGIGGGFASCGNITISGGNITATGGNEGAGIGGGCNRTCGNITISGGTVEATGGNLAAGIGGGNNNPGCGTITITSGVTSVTATKGNDPNNYVQSIGCGDHGSEITVTIGGVSGAITESPYTYDPSAPAATDLSTLTADYEAKDGETLTGTLANNVKISIADGATVTLKDVTINGVNNSSYNYAGITCAGDATITLEGTNTVKGFHYKNPGIFVSPGKTLVINGTGELNARSNGFGAGIGGGFDIPCGNIVINSGTITATGGQSAAGIGGGSHNGLSGSGSCGNITINGGTITATGGQNAAGIGGGFDPCGNITISGGTITATGGKQGAGIGGGCNRTCGNITISGGTITATGGDYAAGIGGGRFNPGCGTITITSGVTSVTATKGNDPENIGSYAESIGCGDQGSEITVTIGGVSGAITESPYTYDPSATAPDPTPTATDLSTISADYEAKDGETLTGTLANNVKISIADGATVTLKDVNINGSGSWDSGNYAGLTPEGDATIILEGENTVKGFYEEYPGIYVHVDKMLTIQGTGTLNASSNGYGAGIGGGFEMACGNIVIKGGNITATGGLQAAGIGSGEDASCGSITINDGTVTATGGAEAAGIGGGYQGTCGDIYISGGTITAKGGYGAAGIGGGRKNKACGTITITSGVTKVEATKDEDTPCSIGKGLEGTDITVTIEDGANVTQN